MQSIIPASPSRRSCRPVRQPGCGATAIVAHVRLSGPAANPAAMEPQSEFGREREGGRFKFIAITTGVYVVY